MANSHVRVVAGPGPISNRSSTSCWPGTWAGIAPIGPAIEIDVPGQYLGLSLAFRPDGRRLATWGAQGPLRIWDLASGREARAGDFRPG